MRGDRYPEGTAFVPTLETSLSRTQAIRALGVTYMHSGDWREPVVELLGADRLVFSGQRAFPSEEAAVQFVREQSRAQANRDVASAEAMMGGFLVPTRLWLARNSHFFRRREVGLIQTEAIASQRLRSARRILAADNPVEIVRLPNDIAMPPLFSINEKVWVVDSRGHPREAPRMTPSAVRERLVSGGGGTAHAVRYMLEGFAVPFEAQVGVGATAVLVPADPHLKGYSEKIVADRVLDLFSSSTDGDAVDTQQEPVRAAGSGLVNQLAALAGLGTKLWLPGPSAASDSGLR
jgi:hypothetical protein